MKGHSKAVTIIPLYIPWLLAWMTQLDPASSYWIAWAGSFFIFYWTLASPFRYLSDDLPIQQQIMRPIFIVQLIFAGFMCCTSVFYFLDLLGYRYFEQVNAPVPFLTSQLGLVAYCQRLSVLAHAALVTGLILATGGQGIKKRYTVSALKADNLLVFLSVGCYFLGILTQNIAAIAQFAIGLINIGVIAAAFLIVKGLWEKKTRLILTGGAIFILNFIQSTLTGYKEQILVHLLIMGYLAYPYYKRATLFLGIPVLLLLFYVLPTYVEVIRSQAWSGKITAEEARFEAIEILLDDENNRAIGEMNWEFLTDRLSEIGMFTRFVESTPADIDYYGFDILIQSVEALIPRALWPEKPNMEEVSMERVYQAGVVNRASTVSAKTRPVVDGYLSAGVFGVFISMLLYGLICQALCNQAESLFGGYQLGTVILFNGLFQSLWRGNNFEFMINTVFYSYVLMLLIFQLFKITKVLVPVTQYEDYSNQRLL